MTRRLLALGTLLALGAGVASCTVGDGAGTVTSAKLRVDGCYEGRFDLAPTFFASSPYRGQQFIRLQRRNDLIENSDGVEILVADTVQVRNRLGTPLKVGLPAAVTPPGVPITPDKDPPLVQLTLYLHESCHGENIALHGVAAPAGGAGPESRITFIHLFDGDPTESDADQKLIEGSFEVWVGDPRDEPPGGGPIPKEKLSLLTGSFRFFFERGQPAQPFP